MRDEVGEYLCGLCAREDETLLALREEADRTGLPPIAITPDTGRVAAASSIRRPTIPPRAA